MARATSRKPPLSPEEVGLKYGFRSGLEERIAADLRSKGVAFTFEEVRLSYLRPARKATYTPDFVLSNGVIIESKGRFVTADRQKHLIIKNEHPDLDIRFVFSNSRQRISKQSATTYAMWCEKHGFRFADRAMPIEWARESSRDAAVNALKRAQV